ncbi:MAG: dTMP kinase [Legionella sp.]|nr:dTMP kinase [Legionella sp.]
MTTPGKLIVIEGLEGAGKSTVIAALQTYLKDRSFPLFLTHEPGGTTVGSQVRHLIKTPLPMEPMDARCELLLLYAARVQLIEQVIRPKLAEGTWILADRFELSTFAYQGAGRRLDVNVISTLSNFCLDKLKPDLILFLDVPPELGLNRVKKRGPADRMEQESLAFFQRVYEGYHAILPTLEQAVIIDATQPKEFVSAAALNALQQFIEKNQPELADVISTTQHE